MINKLINWFYRTFTQGFTTGAPDYPAAMQASGTFQSPNQTVVASAATITITSISTKLTGAAAITLVKIPTGYRGLIILIGGGANAYNSGGTYAGSDGVNESIPFSVSSVGATNKASAFWCDGTFLYPTVLAAAS